MVLLVRRVSGSSILNKLKMILIFIHSSTVLNKTRSGGILVNDVLMHVQELGMPFGGCGPSGMGSYHGQKSFDTFTHERSTMVKNSGLDSVMQIRYPPYDNHKQDIMVAFTMGLPGNLAQKIKSSVNLVSSFKTVFFQKKAKM
jgi:hypothetical protein